MSHVAINRVLRADFRELDEAMCFSMLTGVVMGFMPAERPTRSQLVP